MFYGTKKQKIGLAICYSLYLAIFVYVIVKAIIINTMDIAGLTFSFICLFIVIVPMLLLLIPNTITMFFAVMVVFVKFIVPTIYLLFNVIMQIINMGGYAFLAYELYIEIAGVVLLFVTLIFEIMVIKNIKLK